MTETLTRIHIGDLHLDEEGDRQSLDRLRDIGAAEEMWHIAGLWTRDLPIAEQALHRIVVACGEQDEIYLLVRDETAIPRRRLPVALGQDCHAIGERAVAGIEGRQLRPNKIGRGR